MPQKIVLCVDDDSLFTDLYRQSLEAHGYTVTVGNDPAEGYAEAHRVPPDVILLDVMMPEKGELRDGFDLLKKLRAEPSTKDVPVIMISAMGNADDVRHGLSLGANSYLPKQEMVPSRLLSEIAKVLGLADIV